MIYAVIVLSVCVLFLLVAVLLISVKCLGLNSKADLLLEQLSNQEEIFCRAQSLVHDKFGFYIPGSRLYLEMAERQLQESKQTKEGES